MLLHCWWKCKFRLPLWKMAWRFLKKNLQIKQPYDPPIPLLGIYPEETKTEKDTCIPLFIAALFTIARTWKQPRRPLTEEWLKKLWNIYIYIYTHTHVYIHNGILLSHKKECLWVSSNEVDEPRISYTEWSKSERER